MSTVGPMGRTVGDVALFHGVLVGELSPLAPTTAPPRAAYSPNLGGLPVDPEVRRVTEAAVNALADAGWRVDEAEPDLSASDGPFDALRGLSYWLSWAHLIDDDRIKQSCHYEIALGRDLSEEDTAAAVAEEERHRSLWADFFTGSEGFDLLLAPVSQVPPFPVGWESVPEIDGVSLPHYKDWMRSCCRITVPGGPAISIPAGFTSDGLPVGLQLAGPRGADRRLLAYGGRAEEVFGVMPSPDLGTLATTNPTTLPPGPLG